MQRPPPPLSYSEVALAVESSPAPNGRMNRAQYLQLIDNMRHNNNDRMARRLAELEWSRLTELEEPFAPIQPF